jgi:uncharacterized membrane protein
MTLPTSIDPTTPTTPTHRQRALRTFAAASLIALIVLLPLWELQISPLRPGGSWLALKALPLLLALPGVLKARLYTLQWAAMLILLYLAEGVVRLMSDQNPAARLLAAAEIALSVLFFFSSIGYLRPFKQIAKARIKNRQSLENS